MSEKFTPFENTGNHKKIVGNEKNSLPLFERFLLKNIALKNRIAVPPMCTYSATDGIVNDFHLGHYTALGRGGAGLVIVEATAVSPEGRISPSCLGIWNDEHVDGLSSVAHTIKLGGAVPGIQLGHAGRKASANEPWNGDDHIAPNDPRGWDVIGPSDIAYGAHLPKVPKEMTLTDIKRVQNDFKEGARRAKEAGFEWLELHFAHGYLAQSFFSSYSNKRSDKYGGDFAGRTRFIIETFEAVREVWPEEYPLTIRFGVLEFDDKDEETINESIKLINILAEKGLDLLNVSVGFSVPDLPVPWGEAFVAGTAKIMKESTNIAIASAWGLGNPHVANSVIENGSMDITMFGRAYLANPYYTFKIAKEFGVENASRVLSAPYAHWLERYSKI